MNRRRFGRTGLSVSEIAFGGGRSGGILIDADDDTRRAAVRTALDLGVNWFDTAPQYGDGKSEEALGWLLAEIPEEPYVSTKVRIDLARSGDLAGQVERSLHESLTRLKRESVDLLQIHSPITPEAGPRSIAPEHVLAKGGVADGLERMRDQGLVRFLGLTALGEKGATRTVIDSGRFDAAQVYYNLIAPTAAWDAAPADWPGYDASGIIPACAEQDMAVMAIRIFAASYLASPARTGRESVLTANTAPDTEADWAEAVFAALGGDHGSRAQTALRFVLADQRVSTALIGLAETRHIEEAAAGAALGPLPADALARLRPLYDSAFGAA